MATTTNYGWTTPNDTDLVKDGAAAIRTLGSSVDTTTKNLNPQTTTGALAYRSATANVNTALPIGTAGQILAVNSGATAPEWVAAPGAAGSLIYITSSSFSGSSAVNVNNCFSATYKNYLINIENTELGSGSDIKLRARLRVGGSDNTTSNYQESRQGRTWYGSPASFESSTSNGDGWFFWGNFETTTGADATRGAINTTVTLYQPFATAFTGYNLLSQTSDASQRAGGKFAATTSFTGFTIFPASSTITGTVKVYGIKDS